MVSSNCERACSCYWSGYSRGGSCQNVFVLVGPCCSVVVGVVIQGVVVVKMCLF